MSFGKMNGFAELVRVHKRKDADGFVTDSEETVANFRAYREGRHGSVRWANLAAFSEATDLFRFRRIPDVDVSTEYVLVYGGERFEIKSVEDVKGRGLYTEVLAKRIVSTNG